MVNVTPALLHLPTELRSQIWKLAFSDIHISSYGTWQLDTPSDCEPCLKRKENTGGDRFAFTSYEIASQPLFTCKQIFNEASSILHSTLVLHISNPGAIMPPPVMDQSKPHTHRSHNFAREALNHSRIRNDLLHRSLCHLTLYVHLDDISRYSWITALGRLKTSFPSLSRLIVHNHMRPPISYDYLVDAIYLAGPLCTLPAPLTVSQNLKLHLAYCKHEIMFEAEFLGSISTADSIDEHSLVVRELFTDETFVSAAREQRLNEMTGALLAVARAHERRWIEGLHRRRFVQMHVDAGMERSEAEALVQREMEEATDGEEGADSEEEMDEQDQDEGDGTGEIQGAGNPETQFS